jgi:amino acid permease
MYTLAGFDLTTHNSAGRDDTTMQITPQGQILNSLCMAPNFFGFEFSFSSVLGLAVTSFMRVQLLFDDQLLEEAALISGH